MEQKVHNPYFSISISPEEISDIKNKLEKELNQLFSSENISVTQLPDPHITISYTLGSTTVNNLQHFIDEVTESSFYIKITGIRLIRSKYYQGTIIALILENSDDYLYSRSLLKEILEDENKSFTVKEQKSQGGFEAHISLFLIPNIDAKLEHVLPLYLENSLTGVGKLIKAKSIDIFDASRTPIMSGKFP